MNRIQEKIDRFAARMRAAADLELEASEIRREARQKLGELSIFEGTFATTDRLSAVKISEHEFQEIIELDRIEDLDPFDEEASS